MHYAPENPYHGEDAEQLIGALAGVVSAHIVTDGAGRMLEIHVLAAPELHPKQVVRNVESALSAGLGIQVDRRIVSVAQVRTANGGAVGAATGNAVPTTKSPHPAPEPHAPEPHAPTPGHAPDVASGPDPSTSPEPTSDRLEYIRYESHRDEERCQCRVLLRSAEGEVTGSGTGPDTAGGRAEAAARAVFDALGQARPGLRIELGGAVISQSRGRSFVIISAHVLQDRTTVPLAGAAVLSRSPEEAAILAALQATNRWSD